MSNTATNTTFDRQDGIDLIDARALAALGLHDVTGLSIAATGTSGVVGFAGNTLTITGTAGLITTADFLCA